MGRDLTPAERQPTSTADPTLESALADMERLGRPRVGKFGDGWHCTLDMYVTAVGATFEIKSDFGHRTPLGAALECRNRVRETLKSMGIDQ